MNLKAYWQHLVTREKALWKSATIYVGALIVALPDIATWLQANFSQVAQYIPPAWRDRSISVIGLIVLLARLRSMVKLPPPAPMPPPANEAIR
jgi:hypothetical protein